MNTGRRTLIINADDLGYTRGVNLAVARCRADGAVRSTTLMANGAAFEDAVAMIGKAQGLGVGIHLVLTELRPLSPPQRIPGLVTAEGFLPSTPGDLMLSLLRGKISAEDIRRELSLQVEKVLDCGITPTHLDSHKHVHVLPQVLDAVIDVARKYSIHWIRNPFDRTLARHVMPVLDQGQRALFCKQHLKARLVLAFRSAFFRRLREAGMYTPDHFFGVSLTGIWNEAAMTRLLYRLPPGLSEWMFHPGNCDAELQARPTRLKKQREKERNLLLSPVLKNLLLAHDIALRYFGQEIA